MEDGARELSPQARSLWGKLSLDGTNRWLPLWVHLADTAEIASILWQYWLPRHTKEIIAEGIIATKETLPCDRMAYAECLVKFLGAAHDCGKADKFFVDKARRAGFSDIVDDISGKGLSVKIMNSAQAKDFPHALVGERILELCGLDRSIADVVGAHHGKPVDDDKALLSVEEFADLKGRVDPSWKNVQEELVSFTLKLAGLEQIPQEKLTVPAQVLLSGLLIMADWLASDEKKFPLVVRDLAMEGLKSSQKRAWQAWGNLRLSEYRNFSSKCEWGNLYKARFNREPRPVQVSALLTALNMKQPGLMVIEAPMGEGKTEAALAAAEVFAKKFGLGGVYFALPTQATSDGLFPRIAKWIERLRPENKKSIFLAHGKAGFNEDYMGIKLHSHLYDEYENEGEAVIVNDWTQGRKKGLLADFVVGTIDQVLMGGLKAKHLALRHLGLANKVVILDECHAYDAYMNQYLDLVVKWLGAYKVPVIVLSATLPQQRRKELLKSYQEGMPRPKNRKKSFFSKCTKEEMSLEQVDSDDDIYKNSSYPLISYTEGLATRVTEPQASGVVRKVYVKCIDDEFLLDKLEKLLADGGCVGIIRNTVAQAQETARVLEMYFGEEYVRLLHSRFLSFDRVDKEQELRELLGPGGEGRPDKLIVVGTQVMEQSLDVDFDVLFTDICPIDLLLQRIGRLHRHKRLKQRPTLLREAQCYVMGNKSPLKFEEGTEAVYGKYLLLRTRSFLTEEIAIPTDIPKLVQQVYDNSNDDEVILRLKSMDGSVEAGAVYEAARDEYRTKIATKKTKATTFQIKTPKTQKDDLLGWLNTDLKDDPSGKRGEATVRDSGNSLDVLVVCQKQDGHIYTVPWLHQYGDIRIDEVPDEALAKTIAGCSVSLPGYFVKDWNIDKTIDELEQIVLDKGIEAWYSSHWLRGELFLVFDEENEMKLLDKRLVYDERFGLWMYEEE